MCAPLWDTEKGDYCGVLTSSDICDIMRIFYAPGAAASALSELTIAAWREFAGSTEGMRRGLSSPQLYRTSSSDAVGGGPSRATSTMDLRGDDDVDMRSGVRHGGVVGGDDSAATGDGPDSSAARPPAATQSRARRRNGATARRANPLLPHLISIHPEDDLLTVSIKLRAFGIHHMPVLDGDQNAVIGVLSHRALLAHVVARYSGAPFGTPLCELGVGSFADVVVVPESASVISVLNVLAERRISAVPLVAADTGALLDVYARDDVAFLANDPSLMVRESRRGGRSGADSFALNATALARPALPHATSVAARVLFRISRRRF